MAESLFDYPKIYGRTYPNYPGTSYWYDLFSINGTN